MDDAPKLDHAAQLSASDFDQALQAQLQACRKAIEHEPSVPLALRKDRLKRLLQMIQGGRESLLGALSADFGRRSPLESETIEILPLTMALRHALSHLSGWMRDGRRSAHWTTWPASAAVDYVPLGVVGIMSPWNYPLMLSLGPAIGAIAAGNRVIFKPSEAVPHTNAVLKTLLERHFAPEECALLEGGVQAAQAFAAAPWDHLVFTGSTPVGLKVMQNAAQSMVPVTLELGGRCPAWLDPKVRLESVIEPLLRGKLMNAGQTCVAPNHLYCPRSRLSEFLQKAPQVAQRMYPQGLSDPHYTSLIHEGHKTRVQGWVQEAKDAAVAWVPLLEQGELSFNCIEPGILVDPPPEVTITHQEIFGPVLVVHSFDDANTPIPPALEQELVARPHPLALHIFSEDSQRIRHLRGLARTGMVVVNAPLVHAGQDNIPFGGLGDSGVGNYHGQEGFLRFSHQRSYYRQRRPNALNYVFPPYDAPIKEKMLALLRKFA